MPAADDDREFFLDRFEETEPPEAPVPPVFPPGK